MPYPSVSSGNTFEFFREQVYWYTQSTFAFIPHKILWTNQSVYSTNQLHHPSAFVSSIAKACSNESEQAPVSARKEGSSAANNRF